MFNRAELFYKKRLCETSDANLAVRLYGYVGLYVELPLLALSLLLLLFLLLDSNMLPAAETMVICLILDQTVTSL